MKSLLVLLGLVVAQTSSFETSKLLLTVYYESKCPDSRKFIIDQLLPTMNEIQDYVQLKLIPFGKAKSINLGGFQCQHGPTECRGNMVQDCTLEIMAGRSDADKANYVACEMQSLAGTTGNLQCVQNANVPVKSVQQCLNSKRGIELQLISERLTNLVRPKFIPTVTVNGYFDQRLQDHAQENLFEMLCGLLPNARPCAKYHNHTALQTLFSY